MPFTIEQFLDVFTAYNRAVFPMQLILAAAALVAMFLAVKPSKNSNKSISAILAFFWLWMGAAYHLLFFSRINPAAFFFGAFFIFQAVILFYAGVLKDELSFRFRFDPSGAVGILLILYALVVYPLLGFVFGHVYPPSPTFGLPFPTTIFTFGLLLWADKKVPWYVLTIPLLWSFIGVAAELSLGIREDIALPLAGIIGTAILLWHKPRKISNGADDFKEGEELFKS